MKKFVNILQEWSIPLIGGVLVALFVANIDAEQKLKPDQTLYYKIVHTPLHRLGEIFSSEQADHHDHDHGGAEMKHAGEAGAAKADHGEGSTEGKAHGPSEAGHEDGHVEAHGDHGHAPWEHYLTLHFLINDIFMVLFFGIAAKEITEACLPGGALNPMSKAINPLLGTLGGVFGPVGVYLLLDAMWGPADGSWTKGWGIPTATDIALAWLVARAVFGNGHPAVSFLLLLAVADDAIGLGIIAFAYPNPNHPTEWLNTAWIVPGMAIAYALRRMQVKHWAPYVYLGGGFSWWGLYSAGLHPALALVLIVPFLPGPQKDAGLFQEEADYDEKEAAAKAHHAHAHSPLEQFEHSHKIWVDFGLFFFAFANAGVQLGGVSSLTWIVLASLLIGKTIGITLFSYVGALCGVPLPDGIRFKHLIVAGIVAGIGLTVALFVSAQAFTDLEVQGAAKMGALFSGGVAFVAIVVGRMLGVKDGAGAESGASAVPEGPQD